jgi:sulfatase maturation enzyme AslB (radical SAM superfamily)
MNNNQFYDLIDPTKTNQFIITWDTGKRCNFDCSYCGSDRHDLFSPFPVYDELIKGVDFIKEYVKILFPYRKEKTVGLSLTGGEPTANPSFKKFSKYLYDSFKDFEYRIDTMVTTNGSYSPKLIDVIAKNYRGITLSYHCDSNERIKKKVRQNILDTYKVVKSFRVNLMMHPYDQYWNECLNLIEVMEDNNIKFVPRVINGLDYSEEQSKWLAGYWDKQNTKATSTKILTAPGKNVLSMMDEVYPGRTMKDDVKKVFIEIKKDITKTKTVLGRHCCNKFELNCSNKDTGETESLIYVSDNNFKDWYCGVNWFFLHLESQTDQIFHHQTCQAQYGQGRGAIGKITNYTELTNKLKSMLDKKMMEPIICPNKKCGCGLCSTKSSSFVKFQDAILNHVAGVSYNV